MSTFPALAARTVPKSLPAGREREFRRLSAALDRCLSGIGGVVALHGCVGSGRSELLDTFVELATDRGARVLVGTGSPLEREFPLGLVRQLLQSADLDPEAEARAELLLAEGVAGSARSAQSDEAPGSLAPRVLEGLSALVLGLAEDAPLLIAIDDRQDADVQSLEFLLYLVRRTRNARVLTALSSRETMTPPNPFFEVELTRQPHHERVRLGLLSAELVADLLRRRFDGCDSRLLADQALALTGGNPLLVHALMDDQEESGELRELVAGESYRRGLMNCLHRMDPLALRCARGVAVLGRPAEPALLAELLLLAPDSLTRAFYLLHAAGLFHEGGFRHASGAGDLLAAMRPAELAGLHDRAARLLRAFGAPAETVAAQVRAAQGHSHAPWAVSVDVPADVPVDADADVDVDVDVVQGPLGSVPAPRRGEQPVAGRTAPAPGPVVDRAPLVGHAPTAGRAPVVEAASLPGGRAVLAWLPGVEEEGGSAVGRELQSIRYLFWHGRLDDALSALDRVEAAAGGREATGELRSWLAYWFPALLPAADRHPAAGPVGGGDGLRVLEALMAGAAPEEAVLQAERILRAGRLGGASAESLIAALAVLVYADRADRAARWCGPITAQTGLRCNSTWRALFSALHAEIALRQGDLRLAEEVARAAFARVRPEDWGVAVGLPLSTMAAVRTALGRHQDAAHYLDLDTPEEMLRTPAGLHYLYARGDHRLAVGRPEEALADFRACGEAMARWGLDHLPAIAPWRIGAARAQLALGRRQAAVSLADQQLARLGTTGHARVRGLALRIRAEAGERAERTPLLEKAVDWLEESEAEVELAAALGELSLAHQAQGDPVRARITDRRARQAPALMAVPAGGDGWSASPVTDWRPASSVGEGWSTSTVTERRSTMVSADPRAASPVADLRAAPPVTHRRSAGPVCDARPAPSPVPRRPVGSVPTAVPGDHRPVHGEQRPVHGEQRPVHGEQWPAPAAFGEVHARAAAEAQEPQETPSHLSDAERRVAELAAHGLSNREIARKLYITVSTVEQHLTRVYRKLGVRRRVDLGQVDLGRLVGFGRGGADGTGQAGSPGLAARGTTGVA